jgi:hypothetical protein
LGEQGLEPPELLGDPKRAIHFNFFARVDFIFVLVMGVAACAVADIECGSASWPLLGRVVAFW